MLILGINAYNEDSAACLVENGKLLVAVEEERFNRIKYWAGFPIESIKCCLKEKKVDINQIDYIAINQNPQKNIFKKWQDIEENFKPLTDKSYLKPKIYYIDHHLAHLGSSFLVSPFEESAVILVDGFGDFESTTLAIGRENSIRILKQVEFPHSLVIFYQAMTQYLGFGDYGDEYKVMGLASYGEPNYLKEMEKNQVKK